MRHPCGALPLSTLSISAHYCHHHQAWFVRLERWLQQGEDVEVLGVTECDFGPFDRFDEVLGWLATNARAALELPGGPWVL